MKMAEYYNLFSAYKNSTNKVLSLDNRGKWFQSEDSVDRERGTYKETPCSYCRLSKDGKKCVRKNGIFHYQCDAKCCS